MINVKIKEISLLTIITWSCDGKETDTPIIYYHNRERYNERKFTMMVGDIVTINGFKCKYIEDLNVSYEGPTDYKKITLDWCDKEGSSIETKLSTKDLNIYYTAYSNLYNEKYYFEERIVRIFTSCFPYCLL